ncbi:peptidylprolyl isomerase [Polyangium jinanense]|uniref:SurA N-terminal domain-containing protein n=1 Tax=Polyangium jinanense TaxID=2829994 RepID=A0A9X3X430_9BACT|nr:peptidylprolyl isomerase [Polyangium jinanense]MDC3954146.1 SurA N-terminal domain-containing protein [Polyangium jinanense]MDC3981898.1 SurA N-terminal domain-containing protein [Polyangium jinanense]
MRSRQRLVALGLVLAAALAQQPAEAIVVERIVAVVGDDPILLSDLRARAKPSLLQVQQRVRPGAEQAAAESQVFKDTLEVMIDQRLEAQAAERAGITVTPDEVENAFRNIANAQGLTTAEMFREAKARLGLTEQEYRDEIRRQILEGKMLQLRVKGRVRITEDDVKAMYERTLREERKRRDYRAAWIVLQIMPGSSPEAIAERKKLAAELVTRARAGEDFAALARAYSDEANTRDAGGDLGIRAPAGSPQAQQGQRPALAPDFENAVMPLDPGQVSDVIQVEKGLVIMKLVSRQPSRYTTYEAAKGEMVQRLQTEILEKAKRKWLDELKKRTHLDVRL